MMMATPRHVVLNMRCVSLMDYVCRDINHMGFLEAAAPSPGTIGEGVAALYAVSLMHP